MRTVQLSDDLVNAIVDNTDFGQLISAFSDNFEETINELCEIARVAILRHVIQKLNNANYKNKLSKNTRAFIRDYCDKELPKDWSKVKTPEGLEINLFGLLDLTFVYDRSSVTYSIREDDPDNEEPVKVYKEKDYSTEYEAVGPVKINKNRNEYPEEYDDEKEEVEEVIDFVKEEVKFKSPYEHRNEMDQVERTHFYQLLRAAEPDKNKHKKLYKELRRKAAAVVFHTLWAMMHGRIIDGVDTEHEKSFPYEAKNWYDKYNHREPHKNKIGGFKVSLIDPTFNYEEPSDYYEAMLRQTYKGK